MQQTSATSDLNTEYPIIINTYCTHPLVEVWVVVVDIRDPCSEWGEVRLGHNIHRQFTPTEGMVQVHPKHPIHKHIFIPP